MIRDYLDDYYRSNMTQREMARKIGISEHKIKGMINDLGLPTVNEVIDSLDFEDKDLKRNLRIKYTNIAQRCLGRGKYNNSSYDGREYLSIIEWVDYCNKNKDKIIPIWNDYIASGKDLSLALSIDRIKDDGGYTLDNLDFVTQAYNVWKGGLRPCIVRHEGKDYYFMSAEEGGRYFGIRRQDIGECIRKVKYHNKDYAAEDSTIEVVLKNTNCKNLKEYYYKYVFNK